MAITAFSDHRQPEHAGDRVKRLPLASDMPQCWQIQPPRQGPRCPQNTVKNKDCSTDSFVKLCQISFYNEEPSNLRFLTGVSGP